MENRPTESSFSEDYTEGSLLGLAQAAWWEGVGGGVELGLLVSFGEDLPLQINTTLRNWLALGEGVSVSEEEFWERVSRLVVNPARLKRELEGLRENLQGTPLLQFPLQEGRDQWLSILLYSLPAGELPARKYGGILSKSWQQANQNIDLVKVFSNLLAPARHHSAAVLGNLGALAGNFQSWSPEVLDRILDNARQDLDQSCQLIDLGLSYTRMIDQSALFKQQLPILSLLERIIGEGGYSFVNLLSNLEDTEGSPLVKVDPSLLRIALQVMFTELIQYNPPGQQLDLRVSKIDSSIILSLEEPRTLPLPGLVGDELDPDPIEISPQLFLAREILSTQGGDLVVENRPTDQGIGMRLEIFLPTAEKSVLPQSKQNWRDLLKDRAGRILLAEAQPEYQIRIQEALVELGYRVDLAVDGSTVLDLVQSRSPDLVVLARNLPGMDGLLVTQGIRRWSAVPILMISMRENKDDLLYAYRLGVDDYLHKPFLIEELLAKVEVFLSRREAAAAPEIYQEGSIRIDHSTRQVWVRGESLQLTPIEYNLLVYLSRQGRQIIPYEQLLENVWGGPEKGTRQGLFVHVSRLREKIELDPKNPQILGNKWGVGYVFNP